MDRFRLKRVSWLVNELRTNKSKDCSMVDYLQRKIAISKTLHNMEHHISDEQLKFQILKGLPDCYVTMPLELMKCSVSVLATKLEGLDMEDQDGINEEKDVDDGVSRSTYVSDAITSPFASRRHRRPRRKRRAAPHKKSVRGDGYAIMTMLVLSLLFNAGSKPSDDDTCSCVGTGPDRKCGCVPYAFIARQGIIFAGVSIAAVSLVRLMGTHHSYGWWMWIPILIVVIAYIWNGLVITPYDYRVILVEIYVAIIVSMMGCGLIWLYIKAASQFLGVPPVPVPEQEPLV